MNVKRNVKAFFFFLNKVYELNSRISHMLMIYWYLFKTDWPPFPGSIYKHANLWRGKQLDCRTGNSKKQITEIVLLEY